MTEHHSFIQGGHGFGCKKFKNFSRTKYFSQTHSHDNFHTTLHISVII